MQLKFTFEDNYVGSTVGSYMLYSILGDSVVHDDDNDDDSPPMPRGVCRLFARRFM